MSSPETRSDLRELFLLGILLVVYLAILIPPLYLPRDVFPEAGFKYLQYLAPNLWLLASGCFLIRDFSLGIRLTRGVRFTEGFAILGTLVAAGLIVMSGYWVWGQLPADRDTVTRSLLLITLVPVAEELYFRGLLLGHLRRSCGSFLAVVLVSALFGLLHLPQGTQLTMAALSVFLCLVTIHSGSLLWAVALHAGWNGLAVVYSLQRSSGRYLIAYTAAAVVMALVLRGVKTRPPRCPEGSPGG